MKQEQYPYNVLPAGHGHYTYIIKFRGKEYRTTTNNTSATDEYQDYENDRRRNRGARALREEAIRRHNLR
jgi:hypothetical protein